MKFLKDSDRQYPLVATARVDYGHLVSGEPLPVAELPSDAIVTGGMFIVTETFDGGTFTVGDADDDDRYASGVSASAAAKTDLTITGHQYPLNADALVTWTGTADPLTQGSALLVIEYVREGRSNENQG